MEVVPDDMYIVNIPSVDVAFKPIICWTKAKRLMTMMKIIGDKKQTRLTT